MFLIIYMYIRVCECVNYLSPHSIEHMPHERQRLHEPMTAEDRMLRKQWVMDQRLAPHEPVTVPELHPQNMFRRFFAKPWDFQAYKLMPIIVSII